MGGARHTPHQAESMPPSTLPCPPTSRFNQGSESKLYESECGDQSHQKSCLRQICLRDRPCLDPLDQTGEESNLRLLDLPIPDFAWLLSLATKKGPSRLLVQTTSSRTYLRDPLLTSMISQTSNMFQSQQLKPNR